MRVTLLSYGETGVEINRLAPACYPAERAAAVDSQTAQGRPLHELRPTSRCTAECTLRTLPAFGQGESASADRVPTVEGRQARQTAADGRGQGQGRAQGGLGDRDAWIDRWTRGQSRPAQGGLGGRRTMKTQPIKPPVKPPVCGVCKFIGLTTRDGTPANGDDLVLWSVRFQRRLCGRCCHTLERVVIKLKG